MRIFRLLMHSLRPRWAGPKLQKPVTDWVGGRGRHRRLAVFDGETDMDVLHVPTLFHHKEIYFEFSKSSAANHQLNQLEPSSRPPLPWMGDGGASGDCPG